MQVRGWVVIMKIKRFNSQEELNVYITDPSVNVIDIKPVSVSGTVIFFLIYESQTNARSRIFKQ